MKIVTNSIAIVLLACSSIMNGCYIESEVVDSNGHTESSIEGFGINQPNYTYFKPHEYLALRSALTLALNPKTHDEIEQIEQQILDNLPPSPYTPEIMFTDDKFNYSVKKREEKISGDSLNINEISCLHHFFKTKENLDPNVSDKTPEGLYIKKTWYSISYSTSRSNISMKTKLMSFIECRTEKDEAINHLVCAKSFLNYFNDGSTYVKTTIVPDYEKNIASVTTQTWTTKNPSYLTEANFYIAANVAVIAASLGFIATKLAATK